MGQVTVERLVRAHTNLLLEGQLDMELKAAVLPWDDEMDVEEPEEEEEEGVGRAECA